MRITAKQGNKMWLIYYFCTRISASLLRHNCCRLEELIINAINSNKNEFCPTYIKPLCYFVSNPNLESIWNFNFRFFQPIFEKKKSQRQNHFANLCKIGSQSFEQNLNLQDQQNQLLIFGGMLARKWQSRLLNSKPLANVLRTRNIKFVNRTYHC